MSGGPTRAGGEPNQQSIIDRKAGDPCGYEGCPGRLRRQQYKGDSAAVCSDCGTPAVRVW